MHYENVKISKLLFFFHIVKNIIRFLEATKCVQRYFLLVYRGYFIYCSGIPILFYSIFKMCPSNYDFYPDSFFCVLLYLSYSCCSSLYIFFIHFWVWMWRPFLKRLYIGKIHKRFTKEVPKNLKCVDMIAKKWCSKEKCMNEQPTNECKNTVLYPFTVLLYPNINFKVE